MTLIGDSLLLMQRGQEEFGGDRADFPVTRRNAYHK
jgi:hypothetical protein